MAENETEEVYPFTQKDRDDINNLLEGLEEKNPFKKLWKKGRERLVLEKGRILSNGLVIACSAMLAFGAVDLWMEDLELNRKAESLVPVIPSITEQVEDLSSYGDFIRQTDQDEFDRAIRGVVVKRMKERLKVVDSSWIDRQRRDEVFMFGALIGFAANFYIKRFQDWQSKKIEF